MKKILGLLGVFLLAFVTTNVCAVDVFSAGDTITQDGIYDSTRFVAGNNVVNTAEVDGLSFVAGNEVDSKGVSPYGFIAGNIVNVSEEVSKDLFVAGNTVNITGASIGRDAYIAGNTVTIRSDITRDLRAGGTTVDISGVTIKGDAYIFAENIIMDSETKIEGKFTYSDDSNVTGINNARVGSVNVIETQDVTVEYNYMDAFKGFIISSIASIVTLLALCYVLPKFKENLDNVQFSLSSIIKSIGFGLICLIVVPIVSLIGLFTGILSPVALILLAVYVISLYISSLLLGYIVGNIISKKFNISNYYLSLAIGVVVVKLIKLVPVVGGLVSVLGLFYGLGLIANYLMRKDK